MGNPLQGLLHCPFAMLRVSAHRNEVVKWPRNDEEGDMLAMTKGYVVRPFRVVHEAEASHYIFEQSCMRSAEPSLCSGLWLRGRTPRNDTMGTGKRRHCLVPKVHAASGLKSY